VNPSTWRARLVVDELVCCGVTEAVLCPGSRNAPLAFALHAADAAGRLRLHVRIDERTAGFLALGLALASGRPVPVCTTSGTAVANLHPAMLEASHSGIPLVALTADRPPELVGTGASQTIDQHGIFGVAALLGPAIGGTDAQVRAAVARALVVGGPVHVNVPFADPLVPDGDGTWPDGRGGPWTSAPPPVRDAPPLPLDPAADTLVIAGPGAPSLAGVGVPVVAEPSSAAWAGSVPGGPWLVGEPALRPSQVVVAGRPTLHRPVARLLADPDVAVYSLDGPLPWTDVAGSVRAVGSLPPLRPDAAWTARWEAAGEAADAALADALRACADEVAVPDAAVPDGAGPDGPAGRGSAAVPTGLRLARALVEALPDGAQLVVGSSNPIRDVALAARPRPGVTIRSNRGVAGIDGTVSTALGAALAHPGPTVALMGDLTFLHDTTGLVLGPDEARPDLALVVLNDGGGGIFSLLEQGAPAHAVAFERVFGTPQDVDLAALCAAVGVPHVRAGVEGIANAVRGTGVRVVEVAAGRGGLRDGHADLRERLAAAVAARPRSGRPEGSAGGRRGSGKPPSCPRWT
jgi:2-succinyl-5-enolpyruvyl-6-hydroxy-3-cyclohexene-1-carboxylate synthase